MELDKEWLGLGGVALGWGLNQYGQWLIFRRDERKAIGRALADLLEVRHRLLVIPKALEVMTSKLGVPSDAQTQLKLILGALFPQDQSMTRRYEESVNLVAGTNPILAYRLRSQDILEPLLQQLRALAAQEDLQTMAMVGKIEEYLLRQFTPHLEGLLRELSKRHGWRTHRKTNRKLQEPLDVPEEFWESLKVAVPQLAIPSPGAVNPS